jgi:hypothetical protein
MLRDKHYLREFQILFWNILLKDMSFCHASNDNVMIMMKVHICREVAVTWTFVCRDVAVQGSMKMGLSKCRVGRKAALPRCRGGRHRKIGSPGTSWTCTWLPRRQGGVDGGLRDKLNISAMSEEKCVARVSLSARATGWVGEKSRPKVAQKVTQKVTQTVKNNNKQLLGTVKKVGQKILATSVIFEKVSKACGNIRPIRSPCFEPTTQLFFKWKWINIALSVEC